MQKLCQNLTIIVIVVVLSVVVVLAIVLVRGHACDAVMNDCDDFRPLCAAYQGEHQFFYSQCSLMRENCLTGKTWKPDHFNHCNVHD